MRQRRNPLWNVVPSLLKGGAREPDSNAQGADVNGRNRPCPRLTGCDRRRKRALRTLPRRPVRQTLR